MNPNAAQSMDRDEQLGRVLAEWLESAEQGRPPDESEYLGRYPEFRAELAQCIADWKRFPRPHVATDRLPENGILGDYRILREVGRGGMGIVYESEQISLGRRVALKVLPFAATMDSRQLQRFQNEARAAASLEHPHIVPVYGVGCERGVHYYAMKFIDGQSLAQVIDELKNAKEANRRDAENTEKKQNTAVSSLCSLRLCGSNDFFKSVAELGIQAAEALEHAHILGIVHRDIKPANLMIENSPSSADHSPLTTHHSPKLWITDFGLARTAADAGLTMTGDVLGTLRYMSPEQALAKHGLVDHRTDVYSLGVTLYELLTGKPAVEGKDREEILNRITLEEPKPPGSFDTSIPGDLETIVLKAMAKNPCERFATAQEMADDLRRYIEDRPIRARRPNLLQRLQSWGRRHKPVVRSAVVVLLLAMGGLAVSTVLITAAYRSEIEQRGIAEAKQQEAEDQRATAEREKKRALLFRDKAFNALCATTGEDVEKLIGAKKELGAEERNYLEAIVKRWQAFAAEGETDEQSRAFRGTGHFRVGYLWQKLGRLNEALAEYEKARDIQRELAEQFPITPRHQTDLAQTHYNLSILLRALGRENEARAESAKALVIRQDLVKRFAAVVDYQQDLATSYSTQGSSLFDLGDYEGARVEFAKSRDLLQKLAGEFPDVSGYSLHLAVAHNNLAVALEKLRKPAEALREIAEARDVYEKLVERFPAAPDYKKLLADTYSNLGNMLQGVGKPEEARGAYESARDIYQELAKQFLSMPEYSYKLAGTHDNLAALHRNLNRMVDSRIETEQALRIWQKLAEQFPQRSSNQVELGGHYCNLGSYTRAEGKLAESLDLFAKAIATLTQVQEKNANDDRARSFLRISYSARAKALDRLHKYADAVKDWDKAIELSPKNDQMRFQVARATSLLQLGDVSNAIAEVVRLTEEAGDANQRYSIACFYAVAAGELASNKQEYADRAMELLQKAVQAGFRDAAWMAKDPDLDPIREREDFKELLNKLQESKVKAKP
jgi:serine/threonine protein kinase/tetratricopeptide (TPR) repeat protein